MIPKNKADFQKFKVIKFSVFKIIYSPGKGNLPQKRGSWFKKKRLREGRPDIIELGIPDFSYFLV